MSKRNNRTPRPTPSVASAPSDTSAASTATAGVAAVVAAAAPIAKGAGEVALNVFGPQAQDAFRLGVYKIVSGLGLYHPIVHHLLAKLGNHDVINGKLPGISRQISTWMIGDKVMGSSALANALKEFSEHGAEAIADAAREAAGKDPEFIRQKMNEAAETVAQKILDRPWHLDGEGKGHYPGCKCVNADSPKVSRGQAIKDNLELGTCCAKDYRQEQIAVRISAYAKQNQLRESFEVYGDMTDWQRDVFDEWFNSQTEETQDLAWDLLPHISNDAEMNGFIRASSSVKTRYLRTLQRKAKKHLDAAQRIRRQANSLVRADQKRAPNVKKRREQAQAEWAKPYKFNLKRVLFGL